VDAYFRTAEHETKLPDGLRFCGSRIARAIYTLRNKRNIAHKNEIDPNTVDLGFIHQAAAWIMAELIRGATGIAMQEARRSYRADPDAGRRVGRGHRRHAPGGRRRRHGAGRAKKLVHGDAQAGYRLTAPGHHAAAEEIRRCRAA
jgi:hypothetical protein